MGDIEADSPLQSPQVEEGAVMRDGLDGEVQDGEMLDEIALCTDLIIAASESPGRLPQAAIDRVLGQMPDFP